MVIKLRPLMVTIGRTLLAVAMVAGLAPWRMEPATAAVQIDIIGPAGSGAFGRSVTALPNGNIVVTDLHYDAGTTVNVGAVYLYDGETGALISALIGSTLGDQVGSGGVTVLSNGNYVVSSPGWDNGAAADAGAVTWGNGTTGVGGVVSAANSLVGSTYRDSVGVRVTALSNGNYVVCSYHWSNGAQADAGAATWGNGTTGISGAVSAANSLVGSTAGDQVCYLAVRVLSNGNYVVVSHQWDNGDEADVGAVTWASGMTGVSGPVSAVNSLTGSTAGDQVGYPHPGVTALSNGNYVVASPFWDKGAVVDAGAATWGNGTVGIAGPVSAANSLVGSTAGDMVGYNKGVTALTNGNYVVDSYQWDQGVTADVGAVTWAYGAAGTAGVVSVANSLVGSSAGDRVGDGGVMALSNGNYVVASPLWDNGGAGNAGAATWRDGTTGTADVVSPANSLVGSTAGDLVGYAGDSGPGVTALSNGNYVVRSPEWHNGAVEYAGAVTWGNGMIGAAGVVSTANSLVGSTAGDQVGYYGVTALTNGNYVVRSQYWDNGEVTDVGAATWADGMAGTAGAVSPANSLVGSTAGDGVGAWVTALSNGNYVVSSPQWNNSAGAATWGNGTTGISGAVSAANSLVGSTANDGVGLYGVRALSNGNFVVCSPDWDDGAVADAGAVTWGNGTTGVCGVVSAANSLVGSTGGDQVGWGDARALSDGNYVVRSPRWDNGAVANAGAMTWGNGTTGTVGPITADNSVRGAAVDGGGEMDWDYVYNYPDDQLVVGRPVDCIVTLFRPLQPVFLVFLPVILENAP